MKTKWVIGVGVLVVLMLAGVAFMLRSSNLRQRAMSIQCGNQMSSVGLAVRLWAEDSSGVFPTTFASCSNEIATTVILHCPADADRRILRSWSDVATDNISYELVAPGMTATNFNAALFRCRIHGHLGYGDGTVFDGEERQTKKLTL